MANVAKVRILLETIRELAPSMTDKEISDIGKILLKVTIRLLNESGDK